MVLLRAAEGELASADAQEARPWARAVSTIA